MKRKWLDHVLRVCDKDSSEDDVTDKDLESRDKGEGKVSTRDSKDANQIS